MPPKRIFTYMNVFLSFILLINAVCFSNGLLILMNVKLKTFNQYISYYKTESLRNENGKLHCQFGKNYIINLKDRYAISISLGNFKIRLNAIFKKYI